MDELTDRDATTLAAIRARAAEWATLGDSSDDPHDWTRGECGQEILHLIDHYAQGSPD